MKTWIIVCVWVGWACTVHMDWLNVILRLGQVWIVICYSYFIQVNVLPGRSVPARQWKQHLLPLPQARKKNLSCIWSRGFRLDFLSGHVFVALWTALKSSIECHSRDTVNKLLTSEERTQKNRLLEPSRTPEGSRESSDVPGLSLKCSCILSPSWSWQHWSDQLLWF